MLSHRIGLMLVLTSLLMSAALFLYARNDERLNARFEFSRMTVDSMERINARIDNYAQILTGVAAYIGVTETVSVRDYDEYVSSLDLKQNFPGAIGISFVREVPAEAVPGLEATLSEQYGRPVTVTTDDTAARRLIVTRMAPLEGSAAMIGQGAASDAGRRISYALARETREPILTPLVTLEHLGVEQSGFQLVRAVHTHEMHLDTDQETAERFLGWVVAPFIGSQVLGEITSALGRDYSLRVYDGPQPDAATLFFSSANAPGGQGAYVESYNLQLYGRIWHLQFISTPAFDANFASYLPHALMLVGLMLTALLGLSMKYTDLRSDALAQVAAHRARQLGAREDENRALLDTTVSVVMVLDANGVIIFANAAAAVLFKRPTERLVGERFDVFVRLLPENGADEGYDAQGILEDGTRLLLDVETNDWRCAEGTTQTTAILRDVTEQITARQQLDLVRQRFDIALAGAEIGIFELCLSTGELEVSDTWRKVMGAEGGPDVCDLKSTLLARVHPDDLPDLVEANRRCINGETNRTTAEYRVRFGAQWRWMYSDGVAVERDAQGRAIRLVGTQTDITDLRHARNALEVSEARFRMVLEDAPVGMALMNEQGSFTDVNTALAKLCGFAPQALRSKKRLSDLVTRKDYVQMARELREILETGEATTFQSQMRIRTQSGEERWGLFNVSWTYDKNRSENVYIAQVVDITDQKKVEQIKSEFVATVSHELRTPLTSIKGALGLLGATDGKNMSTSASRLLEIARVNADRLTVIVNDILDLEKISSGEVVFELENVDIDTLVKASITEMQPFAAQHDNLLAVEAPADGITVHIDVNRTKQVLANLISNACKYSDPGTGVTLRVERGADVATVFVENFGPGIPDSFRDQIFDAFTQADSSDTRSKGGTGLGLNITRQIVARQGGRIGFESNPGGATVFWFTCPLVEDDALAAKEDLSVVPLPVPERLRVLHVEDDSDFAAVIEAGFGERADVMHAGSLAEARRVVGFEAWDVILMDWTLPDGSAGVFLDEAIAEHPDACVIILSAVTAATDDPRVALSLTKSQVEIEMIVDQAEKSVAQNVKPRRRMTS